MTTKINSVVGTRSSNIENKEFNIFVPISLGNKWFTKENMKQYILWALKYSKNDIIIVIADKLHQINIEVKDHYNVSKAERKVEKIALRIEQDVKSIISNFDYQDKRKIKILRCGDIDNQNKYLFIKKEIYFEFENNKDFRNVITDIVSSALLNIKNRKFYEEEISKLSQYVLNELPVFLYGVEYNKHLYNLHPYPFFTKICELVDRIYKGDFNEFYQKIGKPKAAIAEVMVS